MKLTAVEILTIMNGDMEHEYFGIRADRQGIEPGDALDNSQQWYQDWQDAWGDMPEEYDADPDHPYNKAMGCWSDGELNGCCAIGIEATEESIEAALELIEQYRLADDYHAAVYLIGGSYGEAGVDIGERIIWDAECVALVG